MQGWVRLSVETACGAKRDAGGVRRTSLWEGSGEHVLVRMIRGAPHCILQKACVRRMRRMCSQCLIFGEENGVAHGQLRCT